MAARIVEIDPLHPQPRLIAQAVAVLEDGGLLAYPTDTYFGVGCDLFSKKAIARLHALDESDAKKPFSFICPDLSDVAKYGHVSNFAYRTMKHLLPGAFTFVLPATRTVPERMTNKQKQVGIRVPDDEVPRALARGLGRPLVTTSAKDADGEPLIDARSIKEVLGNRIDLILDSGPRVLEPSTIVSLVGDEVEVLREGKGKLD